MDAGARPVLPAPAASDAIPVSGQGVFVDDRGRRLANDARAALTAARSVERYTYRVHDGAVQVLDPPRKTVDASR